MAAAPPPGIPVEVRRPLALLRAGRALLGWTGQDLAQAAGLSWATVRNYERGGTAPTAKSVRRMMEALHAAGVEIVAEGELPGVRFRDGFAPPPGDAALVRALAPPAAESAVDGARPGNAAPSGNGIPQGE